MTELKRNMRTLMVTIFTIITISIGATAVAAEIEEEIDYVKTVENVNDIEALIMYDIIKEAGLEDMLSDDLENKMEEIEREIDPEIYFPARRLKDNVNIEPIEIIEAEPIIEEPVKQIPVMSYTVEEREMLAKILYREARSSTIPTEQKEAVIWTILNRVDSGGTFVLYGKENNITNVVTYPNAFAYIPNTPVDASLLEIVDNVLYAYEMEKQFGDSSGRSLPSEYLYFHASGGQNVFHADYYNRVYYQF